MKETMRHAGRDLRAWAAPRPWALDGALAVLVTGVSLPPLWQLDEATLATGFQGPTMLTVGISLAMTMPLAWRRRAPLTVIVVIALAYLAAAPLAVPGLPLGLLIGSYTLMAYSAPRAIAWGTAVVVASTVASLAILGGLNNVVPNLFVLAATGLFGDWQRLQRARSHELLLREDQLRRARQELTRLAVEHERQRIAEELRDVLAHAVAAMVTQARAARRLAVSDIDRALGPITAIEDTGRSAMLELRRLVGLLRDDTDEAPPLELHDVTKPMELDGELSWLARARRRFASMSPVTRDGLLVAAVVIAELSLQLATYGPGVSSSLLVVLPACMLLVRRRFPQVVLAFTLASTVAIVLLDIPSVFNVVLVAVYTVANRCSRRVRLVWLLVSLAVATWLLLPEGLSYLAGQLLFLGGAWLLGDRQRVSHRYQRELEDRAHELEEAHERAVALGVAFERTRIARELHDVIGSSIGVMLIQASGARRTLLRDPPRADIALGHVITFGQESLIDLRDVLPADAAGELAPQPGLEELPDLVAAMRRLGLHVELQVEGTPTAVPSGVALSVYRIVQEALTNVLKHAGADHASVRLRHGDTLELEIIDDGRGPGPGRPGERHDLGVSGGHGLIGMSERVRLVGGELVVGSQPDGGFRVMARLPVVEQDGAADTSRALASR